MPHVERIRHIAFALHKKLGKRFGVFFEVFDTRRIGLVTHQVSRGDRIVAQFLNTALAADLIVDFIETGFLQPQIRLHIHIIHL